MPNNWSKINISTIILLFLHLLFSKSQLKYKILFSKLSLTHASPHSQSFCFSEPRILAYLTPSKMFKEAKTKNHGHEKKFQELFDLFGRVLIKSINKKNVVSTHLPPKVPEWMDQALPFLPHVPQFPLKLIHTGKWTFTISRFLLEINFNTTDISNIWSDSLDGIRSDSPKKQIGNELILMFIKIDIVLIFFFDKNLNVKFGLD